MTRHSLQHVSSPFPHDEQEAVRRFYCDVLGLKELAIPLSLAHLGVVWFSVGPGVELHFFPGNTDPGSGRHFCLDVDELEEVRRRLTAAGYEPLEAETIPGRPRFYCRDPFHNLIEFTNIKPGLYS